MESAMLKPITKYAVTLAVEGTKLETVAKKIKDGIAIPGPGEAREGSK